MKGWRLANVGYVCLTAAVDTNRAGMANRGEEGTYASPDFGRIEGAAALLIAHPDLNCYSCDLSEAILSYANKTRKA